MLQVSKRSLSACPEPSPAPGAARRPRGPERDTRPGEAGWSVRAWGALQARLPARPRRPHAPSLGTEAPAEMPAVAGIGVCTAR